jgi:hypothetical protein
MTRYSKEMKTTRRGVEDAIKENTEECVLMGGCFNGRIGQCGKCRGKEIDGMDRRKWMESIEWEQTKGRRMGRGETVIVNEEA